MRKYIIIQIMLLLSPGIFGQGIYNNGGKIVIGTGVSLYIGGTAGNYRNETNVSNGSMDLSGTMLIQGNLTNNVAASDIFSTTTTGSEVAFTGTALQTIGGSTTAVFQFPNLTINNSGGIVLSKNVQVNGTLTLTNGLVDIGNNNFTFGPASGVTGLPSATNMIIATGSGQVQKKWTANGAFTFPVGDNTVTAEYSPVSLNFTGGTFAAGAFAGLNLANAKYNDPSIAVSYLNRYWNISQTGITGFTCDAVFQYVPADVTGTESGISSLRMLPLPITAFNPANVALHQLSATGLTAFGTFTGGPGSKILNMKLFLEGLYAGGGLMNMSQGSAGNQYTGTIADKITVELHDPALYSNLITSFSNIDLNRNGTAAVTVPVSYNGSYYVAVKHRNSIETVTSAPVLFSPQSITYDFSTSASKAFGSNLKNGSGTYTIYGGDVNQDGIVDTGDMNEVDNGSTAILLGHNAADVNGDGIVDTSDMNVVDNNSTAIVTVKLP